MRMMCGSTKTNFVQMCLEKSSTQKIVGKCHHLGEEYNEQSGSDMIMISAEPFALFGKVQTLIAYFWSTLKRGRQILVD